MADSTVPTVKAYLLSLFQQATDLTGVTVVWAAPTKEEDYDYDMLWLGETTDTDEEFRRLGAQSIHETYEVPVVFQAYIAGDDPQSTEERAWEMRAAIIDALRADLTLGDLISEWSGPYPTRMELRPANPAGWLAKGTVRIQCRATI